MHASTKAQSHEHAPTTQDRPGREGDGADRRLPPGFRAMNYEQQSAALSPLQCDNGGGHLAPGASPHEVAAGGMAGTGSALPFADRIQQSFGRFDVSGIRAHTDDKATAATRALGAKAYAKDGAVALAPGADLHTVAHEAAHVFQQRGGMQLKGGVGKAGDAHEQQADAVADAVVAGKSAEPLLAPMGPGGAAASGLQLKETMPVSSTELSKVDLDDIEDVRYPINQASIIASAMDKSVGNLETFLEQAIGAHDTSRRNPAGKQHGKAYDAYKKALEPSTISKIFDYLSLASSVLNALKAASVALAKEAKWFEVGKRTGMRASDVSKAVGKKTETERKTAIGAIKGAATAVRGKLAGWGKKADPVRNWLSHNSTRIDQLAEMEAQLRLLSLNNDVLATFTNTKLMAEHIRHAAAKFELSTGPARGSAEMRALVAKAGQVAAAGVSLRPRLAHMARLLGAYSAGAAKDGKLGLGQGTAGRSLFDVVARGTLAGQPITSMLKLIVKPPGHTVRLESTYSRSLVGVPDAPVGPSAQRVRGDFTFTHQKADEAIHVRITTDKYRSLIQPMLERISRTGPADSGDLELTPAAGHALLSLGVLKVDRRPSGHRVYVDKFHDTDFDIGKYASADVAQAPELRQFVLKHRTKFQPVERSLGGAQDAGISGAMSMHFRRK